MTHATQVSLEGLTPDVAAMVLALVQAANADAPAPQPTPAVEPVAEPGIGRTVGQNKAALRAWGTKGYTRMTDDEVNAAYMFIVAQPKETRKDVASAISNDFLAGNPEPVVETVESDPNDPSTWSEFGKSMWISGKTGSRKYHEFKLWVQEVGVENARAMSSEARTAAGEARAKVLAAADPRYKAPNAFGGERFNRTDGTFSTSRWAKDKGLPNPMS